MAATGDAEKGHRASALGSRPPESAEVCGPPATGDPLLKVSNLTKRFRRRKGGGTVTALNDVTLHVYPNEIVILLGPSGCGKTTLLRCVAGLETPDSGTIEINGRTVFSTDEGIDVPTNRRDISMIFQAYGLWPHMSVAKNIAYPLAVRGIRGAEADDRVQRALESVRLDGLQEQYPGQISGGQQQRVSLARALVADPSLVLFDEPLSNIDAKVREQLRVELKMVQRNENFTGLYVTHDQEEALELGDRIAVLREGLIEQIDRPENIYSRPSNEYVARFVGTANVIPATVVEIGEQYTRFSSDLGEVMVANDSLDTSVGPNAGLSLVFRPESGHLSTLDHDNEANAWKVEIVSSLYMGWYTKYVVDSAAGPLVITVKESTPSLIEGHNAVLSVDPAAWRSVPGDR